MRSAASDQLARDLSALPEAARAKLPRYRGELLMTSHGTGCYTSQAAMKRWNRNNELLADAAERAAVAADWLGASPYPREALGEAWVRFLWHQFHDDLTGTSIPEAYAFSWNDEAITQNQFAGVLGEAAGAVTRALDTRVTRRADRGLQPALASRARTWSRRTIVFAGDAPAQVRVLRPGRARGAVAAARADGATARVAFLAACRRSASRSTTSVRRGRPAPLATGLGVDAAGTLENARYRVTLDADGDVASIHDKRLDRELLSAPLRLQILDDEPAKWPAWEIDYADLMAPPRAVVGGPARVRVAESGPARVTLEVTRAGRGLDLRPAHLASPPARPAICSTIATDHRLAHARRTAQGGVPARLRERGGDLRPGRGRHPARREHGAAVRGAGAAVGRSQRTGRRATASPC